MKESRKIYCEHGGCGAKLGPATLSKILSKIKQEKDPNLLVGFDCCDDAAVYKISEDIAMVHTLDYFPPMVSDPYVFGQIAATNALSDIFAMGATFKTALNIVCFPENEDINLLGKIIEGGYSKIKEAGGSLVGGHSINDTSIKYGLSVNGLIDPKKIYANNSPVEGSYIVLTKPLGVGIINAANNIEDVDEETVSETVACMTSLNKTASEISMNYKIYSCTDVTGFGLLGHLFEMLKNNELSAQLDSKNIPYIKQAYKYANNFYLTAAGQRNRNFVGDAVDFKIDDFALEELLFDPQTSGGLLFSVDENNVQSFTSELQRYYPQTSIIGKFEKLSSKKIVVF